MTVGTDMKIYLAGGFVGRSKKEVLKEHTRANKILKLAHISVFDPLSLEKSFSGKIFKKDHPVRKIEQFVKKEKAAMHKCDALVVLTGDTPSDGAWHEMCYFLYKLERPVVLIAPLRYQGKLVNWSNVEATYVVPDLILAIKVLKEHFLKLQP